MYSKVKGFPCREKVSHQCVCEKSFLKRTWANHESLNKILIIYPNNYLFAQYIEIESSPLITNQLAQTQTEIGPLNVSAICIEYSSFCGHVSQKSQLAYFHPPMLRTVLFLLYLHFLPSYDIHFIITIGKVLIENKGKKTAPILLLCTDSSTQARNHVFHLLDN